MFFAKRFCLGSSLPQPICNLSNSLEVKVDNSKAINVAVVHDGSRIFGSVGDAYSSVPQPLLDASLCWRLVLRDSSLMSAQKKRPNYTVCTEYVYTWNSLLPVVISIGLFICLGSSWPLFVKLGGAIGIEGRLSSLI